MQVLNFCFSARIFVPFTSKPIKRNPLHLSWESFYLFQGLPGSFERKLNSYFFPSIAVSKNLKLGSYSEMFTYGSTSHSSTCDLLLHKLFIKMKHSDLASFIAVMRAAVENLLWIQIVMTINQCILLRLRVSLHGKIPCN